MFTRYLALFAIFHGALYGAVSALEHLVHLTSPLEVAGEQHHHHQSSPQIEDASSDEAWINCVFCLDGLVSAGVDLAKLTDVAVACDVSSPVPPCFYLARPALGFHARAPPEFFLNC